MNTAGIGEQFREPRHMESDAYLIRSFRRLSGALGPFVVRRILGTELFERRRQYLFEDGLLTPDLLRFLRTISPSEQYTRENRIAAQDWENYFGELGREAKDRVDRIIRFRNHYWAHLYGYDDDEARHHLQEIKTLLDDVYRVQQSAPDMADLADLTADRLSQIHRMWESLGNLLDGDADPADPSAHPQPARPTTPGLVVVSQGSLVPAQGGPVAGLTMPLALDPLLGYAKGQADTLVTQARLAIEREALDVAVANYEAVRTFYGEGQYDEEHADALYRRGRSHVENQRHDLAMADFASARQLNPALRLQPEDAAPYHCAANEKLLAGEYDEAVQLYTLVLALNPEGAGIYPVGRKTRRDTGFTSGSTSSFSRHRLWEIYHDRGRAYLATGDCESATADFNESDRCSIRPLAVNELARQIARCSTEVQSRPDDASAYADRARAYADSREYVLALGDLDRAGELDKDLDPGRDYWEIFVNRGDDFFEKGQSLLEFEDEEDIGSEVLARAVENYTLALNIDTSNASILHARGLAYSEMGQHRLAVDDYNAALDVKPGNEAVLVDAWGRSYEFDVEECLFDRGKALAAMGDMDQAIQDYETILSRDRLKNWPDCADGELNEMGAEVCLELGNAHLRKGNSDLAIDSYDRGIAGLPDRYSWPDLWINRGKALFDRKEYAASIRDFDRALSPAPRDFVTLRPLKFRGQAWAGLEEFQRAIADYDAYLEKFGRDREVLALRDTAVRLLEAGAKPE